MNKLLCALLSVCLFAAPATQAIDLGDFDNIDAIMEDNALTETANRYSALQLSYFPEAATRIGFESADSQLDRRDAERDAQALRAYNIVEETLKEVRRKNLSEQKKTDYDMLQARLALDKWALNSDRNASNPLLYSQAFDALYDLLIKNLTYRDLQDRDLAARIQALPNVAESAEKNLSTPSSFLSQLAMERAYYAYLSFDEIAQYLLARAQDEVSRTQTRNDAAEAKKAIKKMFDLFKRLAQENPEQDFRLGEKDFAFVLKNRYFVDQKFRPMEKYLTKNLAAAQQQLAKTLEMFALPAQQEEMVVEDIQVPGEETADGVTVTPLEPAPAPKAKKSKEPAPAVNAAQFYAIARRIVHDVKNQDFIKSLTNEAGNLAKFFAQDSTLPTSGLNFHLSQMPGYYAYFNAYRFMPPFGTQSNPENDFLLRLPSGNEMTKQEMLDRDFNVFNLKLLMAGQLVPGVYYRAAYSQPLLSSFRKMYSVPTLQNGWEVYAQHVANERGYIITDEEQLFLAWADYVRAVEALLDLRLHTRQMTYAEALAWLTEENGFDKAQAETMLKLSAAQPGQAISYIYGYDALKNLRAKYQKKQGKKFSLADFHAKVMSLGNIPPGRLEAEMENAYKLEKSHLTQALSTPFYLN